jgi:hypothetical protein
MQLDIPMQEGSAQSIAGWQLSLIPLSQISGPVTHPSRGPPSIIGVMHESVISLQIVGATQGFVVPAVQVPPVHWSGPLQNMLSLHIVPSVGRTQLSIDIVGGSAAHAPSTQRPVLVVMVRMPIVLHTGAPLTPVQSPGVTSSIHCESSVQSRQRASSSSHVRPGQRSGALAHEEPVQTSAPVQ